MDLLMRVLKLIGSLGLVLELLSQIIRKREAFLDTSIIEHLPRAGCADPVEEMGEEPSTLQTHDSGGAT